MFGSDLRCLSVVTQLIISNTLLRDYFVMKLLLSFTLNLFLGQLFAAQLQVACTVPELADVVKQIGGERVAVSSFVRSRENPHFVSARPSFIRTLASADAFVVIGMDLEVGWAPALQQRARNKKVQLGGDGYIDCSVAIKPMQVPEGDYNRSAGDIHPHGNPHYMLSPVCGIRVIRYVAQRLAQLDTDGAALYRQGADTLIKRVGVALYGNEAVTNNGLDTLVTWHESGDIFHKLPEEELGGWLLALKGLRGMNLIDDHNQWPYLAHCFGFTIVAHLEPKAGVPPTSSHLKDIVDAVKAKHVAGIITAPWFDRRHAQLVYSQSSAMIVSLAHQVGSLPGTETFFTMCQHNVSALGALVHGK